MSQFGTTFRGMLKVMKQTGVRKSVPRDKGRKAFPAGERISSSGKKYWETRKNRSDAGNSNL